MSMQDIATALQRVETVLRHRPEMGVHDDAPATARWDRGTRIVASHANGTQVETDMPGELGGNADGAPVCAAPRDVQLHVRIAAHGIDAARLRTLVEHAYRCSPIPSAVVAAVPLDLRIDVDAV